MVVAEEMQITVVPNRPSYKFYGTGRINVPKYIMDMFGWHKNHEVDVVIIPRDYEATGEEVAKALENLRKKRRAKDMVRKLWGED